MKQGLGNWRVFESVIKMEDWVWVWPKCPFNHFKLCVWHVVCCLLWWYKVQIHTECVIIFRKRFVWNIQAFKFINGLIPTHWIVGRISELWSEILNIISCWWSSAVYNHSNVNIGLWVTKQEWSEAYKHPNFWLLNFKEVVMLIINVNELFCPRQM